MSLQVGIAILFQINKVKLFCCKWTLHLQPTCSKPIKPIMCWGCGIVCVDSKDLFLVTKGFEMEWIIKRLFLLCCFARGQIIWRSCAKEEKEIEGMDKGWTKVEGRCVACYVSYTLQKFLFCFEEILKFWLNIRWLRILQRQLVLV